MVWVVFQVSVDIFYVEVVLKADHSNFLMIKRSATMPILKESCEFIELSF